MQVYIYLFVVKAFSPREISFSNIYDLLHASMKKLIAWWLLLFLERILGLQSVTNCTRRRRRRRKCKKWRFKAKEKRTKKKLGWSLRVPPIDNKHGWLVNKLPIGNIWSPFLHIIIIFGQAQYVISSYVIINMIIIRDLYDS
jgi:hypothetical protein